MTQRSIRRLDVKLKAAEAATTETANRIVIRFGVATTPLLGPPQRSSFLRTRGVSTLVEGMTDDLCENGRALLDAAYGAVTEANFTDARAVSASVPGHASVVDGILMGWSRPLLLEEWVEQQQQFIEDAVAIAVTEADKQRGLAQQYDDGSWTARLFGEEPLKMKGRRGLPVFRSLRGALKMIHVNTSTGLVNADRLAMSGVIAKAIALR